MTHAKVAPAPLFDGKIFFFIMKNTFQLKLGIFSQLQSAIMQYMRNQIQSNLYLQTPLLSGRFTKYSPGGLFISSPFEGELIWEVGGGLFHLETTTVSVLHKQVQYKVEKLTYKKF